MQTRTTAYEMTRGEMLKMAKRSLEFAEDKFHGDIDLTEA
jgi:hypothetical protein